MLCLCSVGALIEEVWKSPIGSNYEVGCIPPRSWCIVEFPEKRIYEPPVRSNEFEPCFDCLYILECCLPPLLFRLRFYLVPAESKALLWSSFKLDSLRSE